MQKSVTRKILIGLGQNKNLKKIIKKTQKSLKKSQQKSENIYRKQYQTPYIFKPVGYS